MEKMVKTETAEITMGIGKEKRTFGFIKDSFKNMQGGMLADSSFLKNIFYFSKYEKDMINDETIEFMRARGVLKCFHFVDGTRVHLTMPGVVSFSTLGPLATAMLHTGAPSTRTSSSTASCSRMLLRVNRASPRPTACCGATRR